MILRLLLTPRGNLAADPIRGLLADAKTKRRDRGKLRDPHRDANLRAQDPIFRFGIFWQ